jgi:hypothetical protein
VDAIKELVVDKSANEMVRASAMDALTLAALRGVAQREDVLTFFGGLFIGTEADRSSNLFWSSLASAATDLWPKEILPAIKKAYDDGLEVSRYSKATCTGTSPATARVMATSIGRPGTGAKAGVLIVRH